MSIFEIGTIIVLLFLTVFTIYGIISLKTYCDWLRKCHEDFMLAAIEDMVDLGAKIQAMAGYLNITFASDVEKRKEDKPKLTLLEEKDDKND